MAPDVGPRNVPGRRNRNPRPIQLAKLPGVRRQDAVVGDDPAERRDDPAGMDARTVPRRVVDDRGRLPRGAVLAVCLLSRRDTGCVEHGPAEQTFVGGLEERLGVRDDRQGRRGRAGRAARGEVDMGPRQARARHRVAERRRFVEPRADDEQRVGGVKPGRDRRGRTEAGHPEEERVIVRDDVRAPPGGDDRDLEQLGESEQLGRGPSPQDASAGKDDRSLGRGEELDDRADLVVARTRRGGPCGIGAGCPRASSSSSRSSAIDRTTGPGRPPSA